MKIEGLEIGTPFDSSGLAPWFDMLNHGDVGHVNCKFYCMSPEKGLICEAIRDILTGNYLSSEIKLILRRTTLDFVR